MKKSGQALVFKRLFHLFFILSLLMGFSSSALAEWHFGIGTGFAALSVDGDQGLHTNLAGPVQFKVDLTPEDVMDYMAAGAGLGGYATDGTWMIQLSFNYLRLEDKPSYEKPGVITITSEFGFDVTAGELTVAYPILKQPSLVVRVLGGMRYIGHKLESTITAVTPAATIQLERKIEEEWADVLIGLTVDVPFANTWNWGNRFDAGFGGSEGTYHLNSGLAWAFAKHWTTTLAVDYKVIDYENGNKGDTDWYLYDANETAVGINILYNW